MSEKSYLKNQIKLVSLNANDMFTDEEYDKYMEVVELSNEVGRLKKEKKPELASVKNDCIAKRKQASSELKELIKEHTGVPRKVRLRSVLFLEEDEELPDGVTWDKLKISKCIAEFESEMSRAMGIETGDYTFDKIIVQWGDKKEDVLKQLVFDGFTMDILIENRIIQKKYQFFTAGAAQLRTDKTVFISEDIWSYIKNRIQCGLDWPTINARGGMNVNKLLAYWALCCSATDTWENFDIDRCIVIDDWESEVTGMMMYIKPDYTAEVGIRTVKINHIDGAGMYDPSTCVVPPELNGKNFMFRGNTAFKGLLCCFPYFRWCKEHNVKPVLKDCWGKEWDLEKDNITIIFTASQFKLHGLYKSWDEFKTEFKKNNCHFGTTQYEEDYIPDKNYNYQMTQTLIDMTDEEICQLTKKAHAKILGLTNDLESMLRTLEANENSYAGDKVSLALYPELVRDGYSRQQLKDIKRRMLYDAKSSAIKLKNKRLFAIPDLYAACEFWFLGDKHPKGLLENGEIACKPYLKYEEADVLRSPHLYMEHAIRKIVHDPEIYRWFTTDGVYTSCHDLISRILQFDQRSN